MSKPVVCDRCGRDCYARWLHLETQMRWPGWTGYASERFRSPYSRGILRRDLCLTCGQALEQFMQETPK